MAIFTLHLPRNLSISEVYVLGIRFQIKLTKISVRKGWSDQKVNTQFDKDVNPEATKSNFHIPSRSQIQHNLSKYPEKK